MREAQDRRLAVADAELQRVVAAEHVRQEPGSVGLELVRLALGLVRRCLRAALVTGRPDQERLHVPQAIRAGSRPRHVACGIRRTVVIALATGLVVLIVEREPAGDERVLVGEDQATARHPGMRQRLGRRRDLVEPLAAAILLRGSFDGGVGTRAAGVAAFVVGLHQELEGVRGIQLEVHLS